MSDYFDASERRFDIAKLKAKDQAAKPEEFDEHCATLAMMYEDGSLSDTKKYLQRLGVGLRDNVTPLQVSLLRYVVHRIAVAYDRPPNRFLENPSNKNRRKEDTSEHKQMLRVVERAQLDLALREADWMRGLLRQAVLRFYPLDGERAVVGRVFYPHHVMRAPSPDAADRIEEDEAIAIRLADGYEAWWRDDREWSMARITEDGYAVESQPFDGFRSPYGETLPIGLIFDAYASGRPWLPPRVSRISWVNSVNLLANELLELVVMQTHAQRVFRTDDPNRPPPTDTGPGQTVKIHRNDELEDITPQPAVQAAGEMLDRLTRYFLLSEDLNPDELASNKQIVTGASLRVQERGLQARREAQVPLAVRDERLLYEKLRAVHNYHADAWSERTLDTSLELRVELAEMDTPVDPSEQLDVISRKMALNLASTIDGIQATDTRNLTREGAIERYKRVMRDLEEFPPATAPRPEQEVAGTFSNASDALNQAREQAGAEPSDSNIDAAVGVSAAERRQNRRLNA